jgi:hypothetical protein
LPSANARQRKWQSLFRDLLADFDKTTAIILNTFAMQHFKCSTICLSVGGHETRSLSLMPPLGLIPEGGSSISRQLAAPHFSI